MHERWQELIPFYVAGSLSEVEARALRDHLAGCQACRRELDEWAVIGDAVVAAAESFSKELPPLSSKVRMNLHATAQPSSNGPLPPGLSSWERDRVIQPRQIRRHQKSGSRLQLTLVASIIAIFAFVGMMIYMSRLGDNDLDFGAPIRISATPVITLTATTEMTTPTDSARLSQDLGILPAAEATSTPLPPRPTATSYVILTPPAGVCSVMSATGQPVNIHLQAGIEYAVTGTLYPGEFMRVSVYDPDGWYEVLAPGGGIAGWVNGYDINLNGPCSDLLVPTPTYLVPTETATLTDDQCLLGTLDTSAVNMRTGPGENYDIINAFGPSDLVTAIARTSDGWYRIQYVINSTVWIGWVFEADVSSAGACNELMILDSAQQTPEIVPTLRITSTPTLAADGHSGDNASN